MLRGRAARGIRRDGKDAFMLVEIDDGGRPPRQRTGSRARHCVIALA